MSQAVIATQSFSHGYRDNEGKIQRVVLAEGNGATLSDELASELRDKGFVEFQGSEATSNDETTFPEVKLEGENAVVKATQTFTFEFTSNGEHKSVTLSEGDEAQIPFSLAVELRRRELVLSDESVKSAAEGSGTSPVL